jgi:hypothetical protein
MREIFGSDESARAKGRRLRRAPSKYATTRQAMQQFPSQFLGANLGQFIRQTMPFHAKIALCRRSAYLHQSAINIGKNRQSALSDRHSSYTMGVCSAACCGVPVEFIASSLSTDLSINLARVAGTGSLIYGWPLVSRAGATFMPICALHPSPRERETRNASHPADVRGHPRHEEHAVAM